MFPSALFPAQTRRHGTDPLTMTTLRASAALLVLGLAVAGTAACGDDGASPSPGATTPAASASPATNGIDELPAEKALAAARSAYIEAATVRVRGTFVDGGETIGLDLRTSRNGDSAGTLRVDGAKIGILTIGKTAWFTGDRRFWTNVGGADAYAQLKGKYVRTTLSAADFKTFAALTDRRQFADNVLPDAMFPGERQAVNGVDAYRFKDFGGASYFVALTGEPYPLKVAGKDGAQSLDLDFLEYGKPLKLTPPPPAKVVSP
jgi:hypothetical protein